MPRHDLKVTVSLGDTNIENIQLQTIYEILPEIKMHILDSKGCEFAPSDMVHQVVCLEPTSNTDEKLTEEEKRKIIENAIKVLRRKIKVSENSH